MTSRPVPSPDPARGLGALVVRPRHKGSALVHAPGGVSMRLPSVLLDAGDRAARLTLEFFTARVPNPNTRKAYGRAAWRFCAWCEAQGVALAALTPPSVAAYLEGLQASLSPTSIKLTASALRHWLDFLTERGALPSNHDLSVRTPRLVISEGKTPVLERAEAKKLLASLGGTILLDRRDRAAIAVMLYNWLRVEALC